MTVWFSSDLFRISTSTSIPNKVTLGTLKSGTGVTSISLIFYTLEAMVDSCFFNTLLANKSIVLLLILL